MEYRNEESVFYNVEIYHKLPLLTLSLYNLVRVFRWAYKRRDLYPSGLISKQTIAVLLEIGFIYWLQNTRQLHLHVSVCFEEQGILGFHQPCD